MRDFARREFERNRGVSDLGHVRYLVSTGKAELERVERAVGVRWGRGWYWGVIGILGGGGAVGEWGFKRRELRSWRSDYIEPGGIRMRWPSTPSPSMASTLCSRSILYRLPSPAVLVTHKKLGSWAYALDRFASFPRWDGPRMAVWQLKSAVHEGVPDVWREIITATADNNSKVDKQAIFQQSTTV